MSAVEFYLSRQRPLSRGDIVKIARMTTGQRMNADWHKLRSHVLTASLFAQAIPAFYFDKDRKRFTKSILHPCQTTAAMTYGIEKEAKARLAYCQTTGKSVRETGLWLFPSGNLGASPDGLVYEDSEDLAPVGLIEIKCPYSMRDADRHALEVFAEKQYARHEPQVQGHLAATRLPWCDLVYWSPRGLWKKRIMRDVFWARINLRALEHVFVDVYKPARACMQNGTYVRGISCQYYSKFS